MILQNISKAVREQNYYAVALEFVIVIAGVVIGFQIQAWNEARTEAARLDVQMIAVGEEMRANLAAIDAREARLNRVVARIHEIRRGFIDPEIAERIDLVGVVGVFGIGTTSLESAALAEMERSAGYQKSRDAALAEEITAWRARVVSIERVQRDMVTHRDLYAVEFLVTYPGFADLLSRASAADEAFPPGRVPAAFSDLAADPLFEGALLLRYLTARSQLANLADLRTRTQAVIDQLEAAQ